MEGNKRKGSFGGPKPVEEGQEYDIKIEGIGSKGDGIGRVQGFVVIVPGVKEGDTVKVKVNAVRGKVAFGEKVGEAESVPEETPTDAAEASEGEKETTAEEAGETEEKPEEPAEKAENPKEEETAEEAPAKEEKKEEKKE